MTCARAVSYIKTDFFYRLGRPLGVRFLCFMIYVCGICIFVGALSERPSVSHKTCRVGAAFGSPQKEIISANFHFPPRTPKGRPYMAIFSCKARAAERRPYITALEIVTASESRLPSSQRVNELYERSVICGCPNVRQDSV